MRVDKKKCSIIFAAVLVIYVAFCCEGDIIKGIFDNMMFDFSSSMVKKYYMIYDYAAENDKVEKIFGSPVSLALKYGDEYGVETVPEPDHTDYAGETSVSAKEQVKADENETGENESETQEQPQTEENENETQQALQPVTNRVDSISPEILSYEYLMKNIYTVAGTTVVYENDINGPEFMSRDMTLKQDNTKPQILIYHTHGQEGFTNSVEGNSETKIIGVGAYLVSLLREKYGYNVIHVTDSFDLVNGVFDRSKAYDYAYNKISQVLADNPSVEVVIDLHRDGVNENLHLVTDVNGKPTAQIMFFNGMSRLASTGDIDYLYNPNRSDNLAFSLQMKVKAMEYYPGFTRRNYIQAYEYNQQVRPKALLIEAGAQTNSLEEEKNAMEPLSEILHMVLEGE